MTWIHSCVAINSATNHLIIVVNGQKLEDKAFPIPSGAIAPTNLTGNLLLFKTYPGFWYQNKNKISNLNIFSSFMTMSEMVSRTTADDCGKTDGDYLSWETSKWVLKGNARYSEVSVEDLCRKESKIQIFTAPMASLGQCKNLCMKIDNGTMASVRSLNESKEMFNRIGQVLIKDGKPNSAGKISQAGWAPIIKAENGSWVDLYSHTLVNEILWAKGEPTSHQCAIYVDAWKGLSSYSCTVNTKLSFIYCPCVFPIQPKLILRGLCLD